jgi:hypothetical protein
VGERAAKIAVEYQKSLQKHPNIEPGAEGPK